MSQALGTDADVAGALRSVHDELTAFADLRPGPRVDAAFRRLVDLVLRTPDEQAPGILARDDVRRIAERLRSLCCDGEHHLEAAWAARIAASDEPHAELARFPFSANYRLLHAMERDALEQVVGPPGTARPVRRAALVGAGPLPLTALLLHARLPVTVDCIDRDVAALDAGRRVADALDVRGIHFLRGDVGAEPGAEGRRATGSRIDLGAYDLVVLAALVGRTPGEKARAIEHLRAATPPRTVLVLRSARGLRTLLYPPVDAAALARLDVLATVHPTGEVINSVIVARTPEDR